VRPRIVIPTNYEVRRGECSPRIYLNETYVQLVYQAGGLPVAAPPLGELDDELARGYGPQGVLLSGGRDLSPVRFGQDRHRKADPLDPRREAAEFAWFAWADAADVPILGICLGCQVINVARGGSLIQYVPDVPGATDHSWRRPETWHEADVCGPTLRGIVGADRVRINSRHQQAVDALGRGLRLAARADDGVVEAVEDDTGRFVLAVQWHPEYHLDDPITHAIMAAFIAAARGAGE
jgi:putative glutamine amidotransferase